MLASRVDPEQDWFLFDESSELDLDTLIENARTDEEVRRVARLCMRRSRARIEAARSRAN